jgi:uncharacterized delta-60 repeat protein
VGFEETILEKHNRQGSEFAFHFRLKVCVSNKSIKNTNPIPVNSDSIQLNHRWLVSRLSPFHFPQTTRDKQETKMTPLENNSDGIVNVRRSLDPEFGSGGVVGNISPGDANMQIVSLRPDGKILLVSSVHWEGRIDFQLVQLLESGALDSNFGQNGILTGGFKDGAEAFPFGAKVYPDGKILLVGTHYEKMEYLAFARFLENGAPDTTFGDNGLVLRPRSIHLENQNRSATSNSPTNSPSSTLAIGPNGEIVMASQSSISRFDQNGEPDLSFNGTGNLIVDFAIYAVGVSRNGSITVIGASQQGGVIARYKTGGAPDETFGIGGRTEMRVEDASTLFYGLLLRDDGSAFVTGNLDRDPSDIWGRARRGIITAFNGNGQPNLVFNGGRPVVTELPSTAPNAWWSIGDAPAHGIVVAGLTGEYSKERGLVARYDYTGQPDPTFGNGGFLTTHVGFGELEWWESVAVQPDHKILVAGVRHNFQSTGCVARIMATNQS